MSALKVFEDVTSRAWVAGADNLPQRGTLRYIVLGTADHAAALSAVQASAPAVYDGLVRETVHVDPDPDMIDETAGDGVWRGEALYVKADSQTPATGDFTTRFSTLGGSQHLTQSLSTIGNYAPPGKVAPNFKGAIGVTDDSVEGVDVEVPVYNWTETHYLPDAMVSLAYRGILFVMTRAMNSAPFRGLAVGECKFLGAAGAKRGQGDWEMGFEFAGSPNRANFNVGDIVVPAKLGWDYFWARYGDREDAAAGGKVVKVPTSAHVERVRPFADFAALGIGT